MIRIFDDLEELSRAAAEVVAILAGGSGSNPDPTPAAAAGSSGGSVRLDRSGEVHVGAEFFPVGAEFDSAPATATKHAHAGTVTIALAGGSTPRRLYEILAADYRDRIDWSRLLVFWGDERFVPEDSPQNNYRMAREALLDHVPIPSGNIFPMRTTFESPERAAATYEETLPSHFPDGLPRFDLVLLGIGDDGHTASLFPGSPALDERERWVAATQAPSEPRTRLTLTPPVLANAKRLLFLVSGEAKRGVMEEIVNAPERAAEKYPAAMVAARGNATWFVDRAAVGER